MTLVALLRGINVGSHVVKMDRLRALFEGLGFDAVRTFIASGNVIFSTNARGVPALERKIERHLGGALGFEVPTFLRTAGELGAVARYQPSSQAEGGALYVGFLSAPPGRDGTCKVQALGSATEVLHVHGRELYFHITGPVSESVMFRAPIEKTLGLRMTTRNATTVRKLAAMIGS